MIAPLNSLRTLFACLLFIFPTLLFSQKKLLHLKQGRLFTTEGIEIKFVNLNQQGSIFTIQSKKGGFETFDQNEVLRIEKKRGTEALAWGGYFGTLALLESWAIITLNENSRSLTPASKTNNKNQIIIGSAIIGTLVGMLIGGSKSKYKKVYDDPAFSFSPQKIGLNFSTPNNISSLTLSYHF